MSWLQRLGLAGPTTGSDPEPDGDTATMRRIVSDLEHMDETQASYLAAFAYILGRVAHADSSFSEEETQTMQRLVHDLGHLTEAQAILVVEMAKGQVRMFGSTDNFLVVRRFKEIATPAQRRELLDCLFAVSAADESISGLEEGQVGQIAKELGLTHEDFVAARLEYQEHLESIKRLRGGGAGPGGG